MKKKTKKTSTPVAIPKGKKKGDYFTHNGRKYIVISFERNGKRVRFARHVPATYKHTGYSKARAAARLAGALGKPAPKRGNKDASRSDLLDAWHEGRERPQDYALPGLIEKLEAMQRKRKSPGLIEKLEAMLGKKRKSR